MRLVRQAYSELTAAFVFKFYTDVLNYQCYNYIHTLNNHKTETEQMYMGKQSLKDKKQSRQKKTELAKIQMQKNTLKIKELYAKFQENLNNFAKQHKKQINSDSKFRDKFSEMCIEFDVNPMLAEKSIWSELGLGDFYYHLAMKILDICNKKRSENGGLMKIKQFLEIYHKKQKQQISRNDIVRAVGKTSILGNLSIINNEYICTVPIELNTYLNDLLNLSEKYGFISAKIMNMECRWTAQEFETRIMDLRKKGVIWVDRKVPNGPHYYFLSQMGTDFTKFAAFMAKY